MGIVVMDEEFDGGFMYRVDLGKGQGAAHQSSHALAHGVVEAFDMIGFALLFTGTMLFGRHNRMIRFPKITVAHAGFVSSGNALPEQAAGFNAASTQRIGYNLPSATA